MPLELQNKFTVNHDRLVNELDVSVGFLSALLANGIITSENKSTIQARPTRYEKVDALIEILICRPDETFDKFCLVLKNQNSDLAKLLTLTDAEKAEFASGEVRAERKFTNEQLKSCVKDLFDTIVKGFDPNDGGVLNNLFSRSIITNAQRTEMSKIRTMKERCETLVGWLLDSTNDTAIIVFLESLRKEDAYVYLHDKVYEQAKKKFP